MMGVDKARTDDHASRIHDCGIGRQRVGLIRSIDARDPITVDEQVGIAKHLNVGGVAIEGDDRATLVQDIGGRSTCCEEHGDTGYGGLHCGGRYGR